MEQLTLGVFGLILIYGLPMIVGLIIGRHIFGLHKQKIENKENASKDDVQIYEAENEKSNTGNKPFKIYMQGWIYKEIENYANKLNDGRGEACALRHLTVINKNVGWKRDEEKWRQVKMLWDIKRLSTNEFNEFIKWMFEKDGWNLKIIDGMNDGGIDIQGYKKEGEKRQEIYIQCKNWKTWAVGENALSEFSGKPKIADGLKQGKRIVFVTSSYFSQKGKDVGNYHKIEMINYMYLINEYEKYKKYGSIQIKEQHA